MSEARRLVWILAAVFVATTASAQAPSGVPYDFLRKEIGYDEQELVWVSEGRAVTKVLETPEKREIAIAGVVRFRATTSFFLSMFEDIERFDTAASASKKLESPITLEDFTAMDLPDDDLRSLEDCKPGKCAMKLGEETLTRVQSEVDWSTPDAVQRAERILQEQAFRYAEAYARDGNRALGSYDDKKKAGSIVSDFESLLANAPYVLDYRPELNEYLLNYPNAELAGAKDFLYWAEYDFGKPTHRVNHVTIYPTEEGENGSAIVTMKHLWYTHFFTTGLDLQVLVRDESYDGDAFYLITLTRMRTDGVGGMFGGILVKNMLGYVSGNIERYLSSTRDAVERYYRERR